MPGDEFHLTIKDGMDCEVVIHEKITVSKCIDFIGSFRFALEDGTCPGFHLMGVFACKAELPKELQEAVMLKDLTPEQYEKFAKSVGVEVDRKTTECGSYKISTLKNIFGFGLGKEGLSDVKPIN
jgi:hypothetical protein